MYTRKKKIKKLLYPPPTYSYASCLAFLSRYSSKTSAISSPVDTRRTWHVYLVHIESRLYSMPLLSWIYWGNQGPDALGRSYSGSSGCTDRWRTRPCHAAAARARGVTGEGGGCAGRAGNQVQLENGRDGGGVGVLRGTSALIRRRGRARRGLGCRRLLAFGGVGGGRSVPIVGAE